MPKPNALTWLVLTGCLMSPSQAICGSISGHVLNLIGEALEGATVEVTAAKGGQPKSARTTKDGSYRLEGLTEGDHRLTATLQGFAKFHTEVRLVKGEERLVDIGLRVYRLIDSEPYELRGTVRDDAKSPMKGASVIAMAALNPELSVRTTTDREGRFKLAVENPGHYLVYAYKAGFDLKAQAILVPPTPRASYTIEFDLRPLKLP